MATDDSNQSDSFKCDVCNSVFRTSKYLYAHRRKQHKILKRKEDKSNSENLKCDICGTVFKARKYYIRHRLRSHGLRTSKLINVAMEINVMFVEHFSRRGITYWDTDLNSMD